MNKEDVERYSMLWSAWQAVSQKNEELRQQIEVLHDEIKELIELIQQEGLDKAVRMLHNKIKEV